MKLTLIATGLFVTILANAAHAEQSMLARVTVYWARGGSGSDKWTRNYQTATRVRLRTGHCAVDPRRIPYGSKVVLPDATLVAVDTGKHVRSRRAARLSGRSTAERNAIVIDRFFDTKAQALRWARTNPHFMLVRVQSPHEKARASHKTIAKALPRNDRSAPTFRLARNSAAIPGVANKAAPAPPKRAGAMTSPPERTEKQRRVRDGRSPVG